MTDFLVKCFVKDHDKTEEPQVRTSYGILASIVGICCNLLLFASKLFIGILVNSVSVMADAFNNLSDAGSSLILLFGFRLAGQKPDPEHPFGHGRLEYVAGLIVSMIIMVMAADGRGAGEVLRGEDPAPGGGHLAYGYACNAGSFDSCQAVYVYI